MLVVLQGGSRVLKCLREHRTALAPLCQATLFDYEVRMASSIDFNASAKWFCAKEIRQHCKRNDPWGEDVMHCLRAKQSGAFSQGCRAVRRFPCPRRILFHDRANLELRASDIVAPKHAAPLLPDAASANVSRMTQEVHLYEKRLLLDYRLSPKLARTCEQDVFLHCNDACNTFSALPCRGAILRCLVQNKGKLGEQCQTEVVFFQEAQVCQANLLMFNSLIEFIYSPPTARYDVCA